MTIDQILNGESKNLEFKLQRPKDATRYLKSVVAFANGEGGRIVFGIEDHTLEVVGIPKEVVFTEIDAITDAISQGCDPLIIPDIYLQTIEDKTIIIVDVSEGRQRPYYVKSLGRNRGVFVRIAGTSMPADEYMIRELLFEGSSRSYDQAVCTGFTITSDDIDKLCAEMKAQALKNARHKEDVKDVGLPQLVKWGIVAQKEEKYLPTNAYCILTGNGPIQTTIQCGVFKGTTKSIFVDRREYSGPIWEQIESAYQFVLRNIHLGARFKGIYRQDVYEIPPDVIRELIINAAVHRSYLDHNNIQVAIYDDRLEITSPGKLPMGQTFERMRHGYSRIRNEGLASAFSYMHLIEQWGSGIPRIIQAVGDAGLRGPEFIGGDIDLRVNIYRNGNTEERLSKQDVNGEAHNADQKSGSSRTNELKAEQKHAAIDREITETSQENGHLTYQYNIYTSQESDKTSQEPGDTSQENSETDQEMKDTSQEKSTTSQEMNNTDQELNSTSQENQTDAQEGSLEENDTDSFDKDQLHDRTAGSLNEDTCLTGHNDPDDAGHLTNEEIIKREIRQNSFVTQEHLRKITGLSRAGVRYILQKLKDAGELTRVGSTKKGKWLLKNENGE